MPGIIICSKAHIYRGQRMEPITTVLLNGHEVKLPSKYLFSKLMLLSVLVREASYCIK